MHLPSRKCRSTAGGRPLRRILHAGSMKRYRSYVSCSSPSREFPELGGYSGHTLMTTDGTTLLGADNKAGIAEIMTAMEYLIDHPEVKHGKIRVAFTPDEEIGRGQYESFNISWQISVFSCWSTAS